MMRIRRAEGSNRRITMLRVQIVVQRVLGSRKVLGWKVEGSINVAGGKVKVLVLRSLVRRLKIRVRSRDDGSTCDCIGMMNKNVKGDNRN